jgi:hypothetical protein
MPKIPVVISATTGISACRYRKSGLNIEFKPLFCEHFYYSQALLLLRIISITARPTADKVTNQVALDIGSSVFGFVVLSVIGFSKQF